MSSSGFFICIEGIDKCGKTCQAVSLVESLSREGYDAMYTKEPSDGLIGRFIRKHVLERNSRLPAEVEALLFAADRTEHTERKIKPTLIQGKVVVCDRYLHSSLAYQGATGLNLEWIREINSNALTPDLAIYLDVPIEVVLRRYKNKKSIMEDIDTQKRVLDMYLQLVEDGELLPIDGSLTVKRTAQEIKNLVLQRISKSMN